uniref:Uncharacterized protein n=1 Tax=Anguilla anguilla TaxID=7936 RepID=A0A0E9R5A4_ANGAN
MRHANLYVAPKPSEYSNRFVQSMRI